MTKVTNKEIGRRLSELRKALSEDTGQEWSQRDVARELNMTQNMVLRAERGSGTMSNLVTILLFYHSHHFNMNWVLIPDNRQIPLRISEGQIEQQIEKIAAIKQFIHDMGI